MSILLRNFTKPLKFQSQGRYEDAIKLYSKYQEIHGPTAYVSNQIGICLMKLGKYREAYCYFKKARAGNKHLLEGLEYYSTCLWHMNKEQMLLKLSEQFFEEFPNSF